MFSVVCCLIVHGIIALLSCVFSVVCCVNCSTVCVFNSTWYNCSVLCVFSNTLSKLHCACVISVVHCALSLLVSLAYSCSEIQGLQSATPDVTAWLKRLTLEAPEVKIRNFVSAVIPASQSSFRCWC